MSQFQDIEKICIDCRNPFTDRAIDQEFREKKGWDTPPRRCKECRIKHKEKIAAL